MLRSTFSAESLGGSCPGSFRVSSVGEMAGAPASGQNLAMSQRAWGPVTPGRGSDTWTQQEDPTAGCTDWEGMEAWGIPPQRLCLKLLLSCCTMIKFHKGTRAWDCTLGALGLSWGGNQEQLWDGVWGSQQGPSGHWSC